MLLSGTYFSSSSPVPESGMSKPKALHPSLALSGRLPLPLTALYILRVSTTYKLGAGAVEGDRRRVAPFEVCVELHRFRLLP